MEIDGLRLFATIRVVRSDWVVVVYPSAAAWADSPFASSHTTLPASPYEMKPSSVNEEPTNLVIGGVTVINIVTAIDKHVSQLQQVAFEPVVLADTSASATASKFPLWFIPAVAYDIHL